MFSNQIPTEAGSFLRPSPVDPRPPKRTIARRFDRASFPIVARVSSSSDASSETERRSYRGPKPRTDFVADWVSDNDDVVRTLPIYVGGVSLLAVLFNRAVSGIAPVADASSSQSRADLLTLGLAVTNILAGLVWLSIKPKSISVVNPEGIECQIISPDLPSPVVSELLCCILQIGFAAESSRSDGNPVSVEAGELVRGSLCQGVMKSGAQSYLANLSLYPGKSQLPFLPSNTQAVILQPLGDEGIAIIGGDTIRGFTTSDQAWISLIGEKLDATLAKYLINLPLVQPDGA